MRKTIFGVAMLMGVGMSHAAMPWNSPDALWTSYKTGTVTTSTVAVIVDAAPGRWAKVAGWDVEIDKVAAGTATVKMGVITGINSSSGTVRWFWEKNLEKNVSNTTSKDHAVLWPSSIDTRVVGVTVGSLTAVDPTSTPGFATSSRVTAADTEALDFQNDVPTATTEGGFMFPSVGDVVLRVIGGGSTNSTVVNARVLYWIEP